MQAHDGGDAGEDTEAEDDDEGEFLVVRALDLEEGLDRERQDHHVGQDMYRAGGWNE